jgi:RNA polymerase sigma-70 factor (ECF subfamily)
MSLLRPRTDEESMCRVKAADDHEEFARLIGPWQEPIRRLCARMIGDLERAEDLKQETFTRLFERRKDYQPTAKFSTFLWRLALNLCYDELRRVSRRREFLKGSLPAYSESPAEEMPDENPGPDQTMVRNEEYGFVRSAVLNLPEHYRAVLILRHYEGLKLAEIAAVLDIPEGTVNSRMAEALTRLARTLRPQLEPESITGSPRQPQEKLVL